jgi:hypothetical protein
MLILETQPYPESLQLLLADTKTLLPRDMRLSRVALAQIGLAADDPTAVIITSENVTISLHLLPTEVPKLCAKTQLIKKPEGSLEGRESWFREHSGEKHDSKDRDPH